MANGQIEIHDPFRGHNGVSASSEQTPLSDPEDTVEFRIMMAYATRRRPKQTPEPAQDSPRAPPKSNGTPPSQTEESPAKKKRKKKKRHVWSRLPKALICIRSLTKDEPSPEDDGDADAYADAAGYADGGGYGGGGADAYAHAVGYGGGGRGSATFRCGGPEDEDRLDDVAARLTEISDEIPFVHPELETDTPNKEHGTDEVEKVIALLLRDAGDRLYEKELKDANISVLLGNYSFYETVINSFLKRIGLSSDTETLGPKVSTKTQIAVTCEATTRLSVLDTLPMNRLLGHGARYLRSHYSSWADQHGGYENAFQSEEEEEEEVQ